MSSDNACPLLVPCNEARYDWEARQTFQQEWLPSWAHAEIVFPTKNKAVESSKVVGPAVPHAYLTLCIIWCFFVGFALLAACFTACSSAGGIASTAKWLSLVPLPVYALLVYIEYHCMRFSIVPQAQAHTERHNGTFRLMGYRLSFRLWCALTFSMSIVGHMDVVTKTLFMIRVVKTDQCLVWEHVAASSNIESIWKEVKRQSILGAIPLIDSSNFGTLVLIAWALMLLQPLYALGAALPRRAEHKRVSSDPGQQPLGNFYALSSKQQGRVSYDTFLCGDTDHHVTLLILAEAAHMATVTWEHPGWLLHTAPFKNTGPLLAELQRSLCWLVVRSVLEVAVFFNLQATEFALARVASPNQESDLLTAASMVLGFLATSYSIYSKVKQFLIVRGVLEDRASTTLDDKEKTTRNLRLAKEAADAQLRVWLITCLFFFCVGLCFLIQIFAVTKVMMTYVCSYSIWSFHCIDLSALSA